MKCSLFVASKKNLNKQEGLQTGISIAQILSIHPQTNIDDFAYFLQDYNSSLIEATFIQKNQYSNAPQIEEKVLTYCSHICSEFQKILKIYNKFDYIWNKLDIKDNSLERACSEKLKKLTWLIFLVAKNNIFDQIGAGSKGANDKIQSSNIINLPDCAFLILVVLQVVILYSNHQGRTNDSLYDLEIGIILKDTQQEIDARYFINQNEKLKTPLKMLQPSFGARVGPMLRTNQQNIQNIFPSKKQLFFGDQDQQSQFPQNKQDDQQFQQQQNDDIYLQPPIKRQELENQAPNQHHFNLIDNGINIPPPFIKKKSQLQGEQFMVKQMQEQYKGDQNTEDQAINIETQNNIVIPSKKLLDFNNNDKINKIESINLVQKLNEVVFPKYVSNSPYVSKLNFQQGGIPNTPLTQMMELRNWQIQKIMNTKVNSNVCHDNIISDKLLQILEIHDPQKQSELQIQISSNATLFINKIMEGLAKKNIQGSNSSQEIFSIYIQQLMNQHSKNIRGMIAQIIEKVFQSHAEQQKENAVKKLIYSTMFLKSVVICSCEVQFFIFDVKDMQIYNLIEIIDQPPFDLWRILNIFLKLYPDMPSKINNQFREIEIRIISELAWMRGSSVIKILDFMKKQAYNQNINNAQNIDNEKNQQMILPYNFFFNRVLQASAQTTVELCQMLEIPEQIQEIIWSIIKSMLSCEPQLLMNRHLDQLVMCSIYSVAKISDQKQITFNTIINKYNDLFQSKEYVKRIYTQCVINQESGQTKDIINFYNEIYLKQMKHYILLYKEQANRVNEQLEEQKQQNKIQYGIDRQNKILTPGNGFIDKQNKYKQINSSAVLTPQGTKPFIKAFCPTTPLKDNYPSQNLSMRTIFKKGKIDENKISQINQNTIKTLTQEPININQIQNKIVTPNPYDKKNIGANSATSIHQMTPNMIKLFAFGESSSNELQSIFQYQKTFQNGVNISGGHQNHEINNNSQKSKKPPRPNILSTTSGIQFIQKSLNQQMIPEEGSVCAILNSDGFVDKIHIKQDDQKNQEQSIQMKKNLLNFFNDNGGVENQNEQVIEQKQQNQKLQQQNYQLNQSNTNSNLQIIVPSIQNKVNLSLIRKTPTSSVNISANIGNIGFGAIPISMIQTKIQKNNSGASSLGGFSPFQSKNQGVLTPLLGTQNNLQQHSQPKNQLNNQYQNLGQFE